MASVLRERQKIPSKNHKETTYNSYISSSDKVRTTPTTAPPKRSTLSKLRDSIKLFGRSKSAVDKKSPGAQDGDELFKRRIKSTSVVVVLDAPKFSGKDEEFKIQEPPRRSLDSRILLGAEDDPPSYEPPRRSFDVSMLSRTHRSWESCSSRPQRANVVARLMGLSDIHPWPAEADQACQLQELFKKDVASKEENTTIAESNVSVHPGARSVRQQPDQKQKQNQEKSPKTKQDITVISSKQQPSSFQKVVERLQRLQQSESRRETAAAAQATTSDGDVKVYGDEDSSSEGHKSFMEELLELKDLRAMTVREGNKQQLSRKSKQDDHRHHHQEISQSTDSQAKMSTLLVKTSSRQVGDSGNSSSSRSDKRPKQPFTSKERNVCSNTRARKTPPSPPPPSPRKEDISPKKALLVSAMEKQINISYSTSTSSASSLMRPTIASSARRQQRLLPPSRSMIKKPAEWSSVRDQSESRVALLTLRDANKIKKVAESSRSDSDGGGDLKNGTIVLQECCEKSFRQYGPGESAAQVSTAAAPRSVRCESPSPKQSVDAFENWNSPVSVLEVASAHEEDDDDDEERGLLQPATQTARQLVRNVEPLDKFTETSIPPKTDQPDEQQQITTCSSSSSSTSESVACSSVDCLKGGGVAESLLLEELAVFNAAYSIVFSEHERWRMHACAEHWRRQQRCAECMSQLCMQVDAAIFDDLVYDSIIQLDAQHIAKGMRMT